MKRGMGKGYSDKLFHDTLLYAGSLPAKHLRQLFEYKMKELKRADLRGR